MWINYIALYCLITIINVDCISTFTKDNAVFIYPGQAKSERDLGTCEPYTVCNIVHLKFWFPSQIERLCKCPKREECPWQWSTNDNHTMPLDNRSQLKFCEPINGLSDCTTKTNGSITIEKNVQDNNIKAQVNCNCPHHTTWQLITHEQDYNNETKTNYFKDVFKCKKLDDCNSREFCGYIRTDYYSTYTKCTCPYGHLCLHKDRQESMTYEMLFHGKAYRAECTPVDFDKKESLK